MYSAIDEQTFAIKPMNCPGSMLMYSVSSTPIEICPFEWQRWVWCTGMNSRVPAGSCAFEPLPRMMPTSLCCLPRFKEIIGVIDFVGYVYKAFGFKYHVGCPPSLKTPSATMRCEQATGPTAGSGKKELDYVVNEGTEPSGPRLTSI